MGDIGDMDDISAAQQVADGVLLILGAVTPIPAAIVAGITTLASAAGYFFGVKHSEKRKRKRDLEKEDVEFINKIINNKDEEDA